MRTNTITQKVETPFGSLYIHVEFDRNGHVVGGSISDPWKSPDAQVARLIDALSEGFNEALTVASKRHGNGIG